MPLSIGVALPFALILLTLWFWLSRYYGRIVAVFLGGVLGVASGIPLVLDTPAIDCLAYLLVFLGLCLLVGFQSPYLSLLLLLVATVMRFNNFVVTALAGVYVLVAGTRATSRPFRVAWFSCSVLCVLSVLIAFKATGLNEVLQSLQDNRVDDVLSDRIFESCLTTAQAYIEKLSRVAGAALEREFGIHWGAIIGLSVFAALRASSECTVYRHAALIVVASQLIEFIAFDSFDPNNSGATNLFLLAIVSILLVPQFRDFKANLLRLFSGAPTIIKKFTSFAGVGLIGTAGHYLTLIVLVSVYRIDSVFASGVGFVVGAVVNYGLNYVYTFRSQKTHFEAATKFLMVAGAGLLLNSLIMSILVEYLRIHFLICQMIATGLVLLWNFAGNHFWTFRKVSDASDRRM